MKKVTSMFLVIQSGDLYVGGMYVPLCSICLSWLPLKYLQTERRKKCCTRTRVRAQTGTFIFPHLGRKQKTFPYPVASTTAGWWGFYSQNTQPPTGITVLLIFLGSFVLLLEFAWVLLYKVGHPLKLLFHSRAPSILRKQSCTLRGNILEDLQQQA